MSTSVALEQHWRIASLTTAVWDFSKPFKKKVHKIWQTPVEDKNLACLRKHYIGSGHCNTTQNVRFTACKPCSDDFGVIPFNTSASNHSDGDDISGHRQPFYYHWLSIKQEDKETWNKLVFLQRMPWQRQEREIDTVDTLKVTVITTCTSRGRFLHLCLLFAENKSRLV